MCFSVPSFLMRHEPPVNTESVDRFLAVLAVPYCVLRCAGSLDIHPDCYCHCSHEDLPDETVSVRRRCAVLERIERLSIEHPITCPAGRPSEGSSNFPVSLGACCSLGLRALLCGLAWDVAEPVAHSRFVNWVVELVPRSRTPEAFLHRGVEGLFPDGEDVDAGGQGLRVRELHWRRSVARAVCAQLGRHSQLCHHHHRFWASTSRDWSRRMATSRSFASVARRAGTTFFGVGAGSACPPARGRCCWPGPRGDWRRVLGPG